MAYNKITYNSKTLIDLTEDTVDQNKLLNGATAHDKRGNVVTGTLLKGYPAIFNLEEDVQDSSGDFVLGSASENIIGLVIYEQK